MRYRHVDVFAERALTGNGLIVFFGGTDLPEERLLTITAEMRQFESIFIDRGGDEGEFVARVLTVEEELSSAAHPVIGAAAI